MTNLQPENIAENDAGCGHPNHGNPDHACGPFLSLSVTENALDPTDPDVLTADGHPCIGDDCSGCAAALTRPIPPEASCSHCPPGCASCEPVDCECYAHQDEPDRRFIPPGGSDA